MHLRLPVQHTLPLLVLLEQQTWLEIRQPTTMPLLTRTRLLSSKPSVSPDPLPQFHDQSHDLSHDLSHELSYELSYEQHSVLLLLLSASWRGRRVNCMNLVQGRSEQPVMIETSAPSFKGLVYWRGAKTVMRAGNWLWRHLIVVSCCTAKIFTAIQGHWLSASLGVIMKLRVPEILNDSQGHVGFEEVSSRITSSLWCIDETCVGEDSGQDKQNVVICPSTGPSSS